MQSSTSGGFKKRSIVLETKNISNWFCYAIASASVSLVTTNMSIQELGAFASWGYLDEK